MPNTKQSKFPETKMVDGILMEIVAYGWIKGELVPMYADASWGNWKSVHKKESNENIK